LPQEGDDDGAQMDAVPGREPEPGGGPSNPYTTVDLEWLAQAMQQLPPLDRQVLDLKYGLSGGGPQDDRAIARRLNVSTKTAEWLSWAAMLKLKGSAKGRDN
jgi:DNA-directed RNA polymerase sigma subunit (sigma70/sigma32)